MREGLSIIGDAGSQASHIWKNGHTVVWPFPNFDLLAESAAEDFSKSAVNSFADFVDVICSRDQGRAEAKRVVQARH